MDKIYLKNKSKKLRHHDEYLEEKRRALPIYQHREEIVKVIKENLFSIMTGDTGSGKTTQLPQYIIESIKVADLQKNPELDKLSESKRISVPKIVITQPRRVAAVQMAKRVSYEKNCTLGKEIGYTIRFEDNSTQDTLIKFVTDGILVRECLSDPDLLKYNVIILDEAHERSLYTDILFALCKQAVIRRNNDLRLIVTSATLDTKQFSSYFSECPVFQIAGRTYPVEKVYYTSRMEKRVESSVQIAIRIHLHESPGHILTFLTGFEECEQACKLAYQKLEELVSKGKKVPPLMIMPLYGAQNTEEQTLIFEPAPENARKLIFCTNIAETSLTVDGVTYVIDCGYVKQKMYNAKTAMDSLSIVPISKVQAIQRAGRAGRTGPGKCIRLYSEQFFENQMSNVTIPEILRVNLSSTILTLKSMGIADILEFDFMEKPDKDAISEALKQLFFLQAIDEEGKITRLGSEISKFPLDCSYSRALIASKFLSLSDELNTLVSLISCENMWYNVNKYDEERRSNFEKKKSEFIDKYSDQMCYLNVYKEWEYNNFSDSWCKQNFLHLRTLKQARNIKGQIKEYMNKVNYKECEKFFNVSNIQYLASQVEKDKSLEDYEKINSLVRMCLCQGFFMNAAKKIPSTQNEGAYLRISDGSMVHLDTNSSISIKGVKPELVLYTELGGSSSKAIMKQASVIELKWISDSVNLIKQVDVYKLRGRGRTPPKSLANLMEKNEINLYSLIDKQKREDGPNFEENENEENTNKLQRKAEEAKERYLKRKTQRK